MQANRSEAEPTGNDCSCDHTRSGGINWDRWGVLASLACGIHCLLLPVAMPLLMASGMEFVAEPWFEALVTISVLWIATHTLQQRFRVGRRWTFVSLLIMTGIALMLLGNYLSLIAQDVHHHHLDIHLDSHMLIPFGAMVVALGNGLNWWNARQACSTHHHS